MKATAIAALIGAMACALFLFASALVVHADVIRCASRPDHVWVVGPDTCVESWALVDVMRCAMNPGHAWVSDLRECLPAPVVVVTPRSGA